MSFLRVVLLLPLILAACGKTETRPPRPGSAGDEFPSASAAGLANAVLFRAMSLVGTPYRFGGNSPNAGFDCSGLVGYVFRDAAGIRLPRTSAEIGKLKRPTISLSHLRSGDLVLFAAHRRTSHVGIYVGNGRFVHAPNSGGTVRLDRLDAPGWKETFQSGKRLID
jgi:cell wall-associated NlpC family hydrolase